MGGKAIHGGDFFKAIGEDFQSLERIGDVVSADVLDAWYDPTPKAVEKIRANLPWLMKTSPPTHCEGLLKVISAVRGVPKESVLVGAGTTGLMYLVLRKLIHRGDRVLMLDPTYSEYTHLLTKVIGAEIVLHELQPDRSFVPDLSSFIEQARIADAIILVNPNSPTGVVMTVDEIRSILQAMKPTARMWIDETYIDFLPESGSAESLVAEEPRLIIAKSMSKFYSLSGLRVGYLVMSPEIVEQLEPECPPWSIGLIPQIAAVEALLDQNYYLGVAEETAALRAELFMGLQQIKGIRPFESSTNFILFETANSGELVSRATQYGVFLRDCSSLSSRLAERFVRTSVKSFAENSRILAAIRASC